MIRKLAALLIAGLTILAGSVEAQTKDSPLLHYKGDYPTLTKTKTIIPKYPSTARSGSMVLELTIRPNGTVEAVKAVRSLPGATRAAFVAVKQWKFRPVIFRGKPAWAVLDILISNPWRSEAPTINPPRPGTTQMSDASRAPKCVPVSELSVTPRKVHDQKPDVSDLVGVKTHAGVLIFEITVLPSGRVTDIHLVKEAERQDPWPTLVERWRSAISEWRFEPATINGKPVAVCLTVAINVHVM
jgi:TonB family protein